MDPSLWSFVFGNDRPVEIEIGPGRGDVLLAFAAARPDVNFFAIEHIRGAVERLCARLDMNGIANARVISGDAPCVIEHLVPPASVAAYHIYFPDPWPKRRHQRRRLLTPRFAESLRRTLGPNGTVHIATDLGWLYDTMVEALHAGGFVDTKTTAPARPTTRFERKYATAGTFAATFAAASATSDSRRPTSPPG